MTGSLSLVYLGAKRKAYRKLGDLRDGAAILPEQRQKIRAFAVARAQLVQDGINQRLDDASEEDDPEAAVTQAQAEVTKYNGAVLIPFLLSWAAHQGLFDAYSETGSTEKTQWEWIQNSDYRDDCEMADEASPASFDELVGIAGDTPPVHMQCLCVLSPL